MTLKIIAIISMLIDHIGLVFFPEIGIFRWIGRIAFPIFIYQLVEGFEKTSSCQNYFLRLALFAIISEVPFDLALFGVPFYWDYQNVYFELCFALLGLILFKKSFNQSVFIKWLSVFGMCLFATLIRADYGAFGVLLAFVFYQYKNNFKVYAAALVILSLFFVSVQELFSLLSLPFIFIYNKNLNVEQKSLSKPIQFLFYWFYPLHMFILFLAKAIT